MRKQLGDSVTSILYVKNVRQYTYLRYKMMKNTQSGDVITLTIVLTELKTFCATSLVIPDSIKP